VAQGGPRHCQGRRVAVIDDDAAVLHSLRFLLEVAGYEVTTFASAAAFLAHRGVAPDCIVLDCHMPQRSGLDMIERLMAERRGLRIMLMTGSASPAIRARAAALGIAVVEKPPQEADLLAFVEASGG
jgi:two-component system response regulator FixJ